MTRGRGAGKSWATGAHAGRGGSVRGLAWPGARWGGRALHRPTWVSRAADGGGSGALRAVETLLPRLFSSTPPAPRYCGIYAGTQQSHALPSSLPVTSASLNPSSHPPAGVGEPGPNRLLQRQTQPNSHWGCGRRRRDRTGKLSPIFYPEGLGPPGPFFQDDRGGAVGGALRVAARKQPAWPSHSLSAPTLRPRGPRHKHWGLPRVCGAPQSTFACVRTGARMRLSDAKPDARRNFPEEGSVLPAAPAG